MRAKIQQEIVYKIVKNFQPVRTEQVKIMAMENGVSCADRYLRWLQEAGQIRSYRKNGDMTKTWEIENADN